jgi:hypothetical protein
MAFGNILMNGSYAVVTVRQYDKHNRSVAFDLTIYADNRKKEIITSIPYNMYYFNNVDVKAIRSTPPSNPEVGDAFLVAPDAQGQDWELNTHQRAEYLGNGNWSFTSAMSPDRPVFVEEVGKYHRFNHDDIQNLHWEPFNGWGYREWNKYFSIEAQSVAGQNILSLIYQYLRTRPEIATATDI